MIVSVILPPGCRGPFAQFCADVVGGATRWDVIGYWETLQEPMDMWRVAIRPELGSTGGQRVIEKAAQLAKEIGEHVLYYEVDNQPYFLELS